jgi:hypothetical protein
MKLWTGWQESGRGNRATEAKGTRWIIRDLKGVGLVGWGKDSFMGRKWDHGGLGGKGQG